MRLRVAGSLFALTVAFAVNAGAQQTPAPAPPPPPPPPPTADQPPHPPLPPPPPGSTEPFRGPRQWQGGPPGGSPHWPGNMPPDPGMPPWHPPVGPDGGPIPPGGPGHMMPPHAQRVPVTIESTRADRDAVIERRIKVDEMYGKTLFIVPQHNEVETWEAVCVAPCKVDLDRSSTYRVNGQNKVTKSAQFTLPPAADQVKLEVAPGTLWLHGAAKRVIGLGIASGIVGGALLTTAHTWDDHKEEKNVRTAGWITSAIGVGLVAIGIPIAILTQTHVKANDKRVAGAPPPPKLTLDGLVF